MQVNIWSSHAYGSKPETECGVEAHGCGTPEGPVWDGADKSPSLNRERGATRLLEQAKENDDSCSCDSNSYDQDMVDQAEKMLEKIDESRLSDCGKNRAMGQVIDMLGEEGGVDGRPAEDSRRDYCLRDYWSSRSLPHFHTH